MNWQEVKEFFSVLLSLNLRRKKHFGALMKLLDEIEVEDFEILEKERVLDFFMREDGYMKF